MWPHSLRVTIPTDTTVDWGVCDRCYFLYNLNDLVWQWDQRGAALQNLRIRVCPRCLDDPATTLAPIVIVGPEGVVRDPRPPQYAANSAGGGPAWSTIPGDYLYDDSGNLLYDDSGHPLVADPT